MIDLLSGWGKTENGIPSQVLMKAFVPYVPRDECAQKFSVINLKTYDTYLCAGGANKTDTCNGDSGKYNLNIRLYRFSFSSFRWADRHCWESRWKTEDYFIRRGFSGSRMSQT